MSTTSDGERPVLFTIGHSNHTEEAFLELLAAHTIQVLVDVRSQPFSRFSPHFSREPLKALVESAGVRYLFMGDQLGGRPEGDNLLDDQGHALYHRMAEAPAFLEGIARLERGVRDWRVAIMCSEEDPAVCHRYLLVTRVIRDRGVDVWHIRGDRRLQADDEIGTPDKQGVLFAELEQDSWKSLRSVSPKPQPPSSSEN
jgi:uncharacterized protein (DUF488 family)